MLVKRTTLSNFNQWLRFFSVQLAVLLKRDTSKYSAVIQLLLDKDIATVDYDDICEHVGDANDF